VLPRVRPIPLALYPEPFDHPDWLFEPTSDGFRALEYVDRDDCRLVSWRGHVYASGLHLCEELAHAMRCHTLENRKRLLACGHDLEGIVAKWLGGTCRTDARTSWLKIRNPEYA
jgi:ATP-dependent DNA ligase